MADDLDTPEEDLVTATRARVPSLPETDRLAEWFRVLGDPTRTRIMYALLEAGEMCVSDLAATVEITESTVSHALRWLRAADVVQSRRDGRMIHYRLDDEHVRMLLDLGRAHLRHRQDGH
ncbi:MAG: metalloregulator ArsR/SmtB family transcription factor [Acidimicrobiales bacterium]